jgi:hypothetical protein
VCFEYNELFVAARENTKTAQGAKISIPPWLGASPEQAAVQFSVSRG